MSFACEEITRDGKVLDCLTDEQAGVRIMVLRAGAELVSLARRNADGQWIGFLYRDADVSEPATGWRNHATVMGFYLHRIKNERAAYRGHEIRGATHSFLRHKIFPAPDFASGERGSLTYRISPGQILSHEYPYQVAFALTYTLEGGALRVTFHLENLEPELAAHVSFGLHPGFAATSLESAELFMPAGTYVRHFAPGNFLSGETKEFKFPGGPMPFPKSELPGSFLLELKNVEAPLFLFSDRQSGRQVHLDFAEAPYVTIWSDGHPFICVEPCWGLPDHHEQRPFEKKEGIQEIPPRGVLTRSFSMKADFGS
jgi:galactose mutarotase-like enzyme